MRPTLDDMFYAVLEVFDIDDETYRNIKDSRESLAVSVRQLISFYPRISQKPYFILRICPKESLLRT